ncbi:hypothetical protein [Paeniglutamicibacter psychrophenolicus]|uniref:MFS transporter n=1 Tax=Paeniglutamicibacter psychrophenolicus TaxID=257454 RepID=A0ABS4WCK8_9MICC|nr:hypothetical protein [Paeniglutamicibacter psychrophenolicus]MBP2373936.1 hypothetical protein [Paeniglutamicibacter psychrophenolicus]
MKTVKDALPASLRTARWWWAAACASALAFAAGFFLNAASRPANEAPGFWGAGIALVGLGLVIGYCTLQLWLGKLAGRMSLTWCGIIVGIPLLTRGVRLGIFGALLLVGVALLWSPGTTRYFAPQSKVARAKRRAERSAEKARNQRR